MEFAVEAKDDRSPLTEADLASHHVLVDGLRSQTLGRVSMDMLAVDLSELPQAGFGSTATLWGRASNGAWLSIDEVAAQAGTVGYELMCALAPRVPVQTD